MKIRTNGRAALMVATLVFAGFGIAEAAPEKSADKPTASSTAKPSKISRAAPSKAPAKPEKAVKAPTRPAKAAAAAAASTAEAAKAVAPEATSDALPLGLPPSVANANAQLAAGNDAAPQTVFPDPTAAMAAQPNETPTAAPAAGTEIVAEDQLNEVDRAEVQPAQLQPVDASSTTGHVAQASADDSAWGQSSLIGKIFIAFGGLLTLASAARMFIA